VIQQRSFVTSRIVCQEEIIKINVESPPVESPAQIQMAKDLTEGKISIVEYLQFLKTETTCGESGAQLDELIEVESGRSYIGNLINHYGAFPLVGLTTLGLFSKEIFLWDEEMLVVFGIMFWLGAGYLHLADPVRELITKDNKKRFGVFEDITLMFNARLKNYKASMIDIQNETGLIEEFNQKNASTFASLIEARNLKVRHGVRNAVVTRLQAIKTQEEAAQMAERARLLDDVVGGVNEVFSGPQASKYLNESLALAISNIGKASSSTPETDPVLRVFSEQIEKFEGQMKK